jgi:hypothetical protein
LVVAVSQKQVLLMFKSESDKNAHYNLQFLFGVIYGISVSYLFLAYGMPIENLLYAVGALAVLLAYLYFFGKDVKE